ncbi:hypothetical protein [Rossellomorea aquimaris]|uniref:hypothetical protein n=1 Tax=Rossellomorea aquimaris TaxID=189382 RepID=UPI0011E98A18|nr:hypothetical protein [Rossellomorea aquimaris]TYS91501.1 hypothetical protein FZC88_04975 [Rossellomorea aquimaris]
MKNKKWLFSLIVLFFMILSGYFYQKVTDRTYEGMTVIPEEHDDIPLYDGLEPTMIDYKMKGNHWVHIYDFYLDELPKLGWEISESGSALDDPEAENDWSGFYSIWRKVGFDGELSISSHFNQGEDHTEVTFDTHPIYHSSVWIEGIPKSACVYVDSGNGPCQKMIDKEIIQSLVDFINDGIEWDDQSIEPRSQIKTYKFDHVTVEVLYEGDKEIYIKSDKGTKVMKPEPEFLKLISQ